MQVLLFAGIQKMNEHPRLEDIFRQIKCPKEFQDTVDKILTVENRKIIAKEEKFCFFGTGRTNDFPSEVILFLIFQSKKYPRFCCMAQDYIILGFSADKWNVYKAELEHDFLLIWISWRYAHIMLKLEMNIMGLALLEYKR